MRTIKDMLSDEAVEAYLELVKSKEAVAVAYGVAKKMEEITRPEGGMRCDYIFGFMGGMLLLTAVETLREVKVSK